MFHRDAPNHPPFWLPPSVQDEQTASRLNRPKLSASLNTPWGVGFLSPTGDSLSERRIGREFVFVLVAGTNSLPHG